MALCTFGAVVILLLSVVYIRFPRSYVDYIARASEAYNIEVSLIRAVIKAESGFDSNAISHAGAIGLMQIMPLTGEYIARLKNIPFDIDMLKDPQTNIDFGVFYLARLIRRFGNTQEAIAAYNAGEGNVAIWRANDITEIPFKETRNYVRRVNFNNRIYSLLRV